MAIWATIWATCDTARLVGLRAMVRRCAREAPGFSPSPKTRRKKGPFENSNQETLGSSRVIGPEQHSGGDVCEPQFSRSLPLPEARLPSKQRRNSNRLHLVTKLASKSTVMQTNSSRLAASPTSRCSVMRTKGPRHSTPGRPDTWPIKTSRALQPILRANRKLRVRAAGLTPRNRT